MEKFALPIKYVSLQKSTKLSIFMNHSVEVWRGEN